MATAPAPPTNSAPGEPLGATLPRLWTRPLVAGPPGPCGCGCALTEDTSDGYDVAWFAEHVIGQGLDPWERWLVIHALELRPNGAPRFRHVLAIVARQNGKTYLLTVLCLYWLFIERVELVLSTSTNLDYAREAWEEGCNLALSTPDLAVDLPPSRNRGIYQAQGQQRLTTDLGNRWKIGASNRRGGRSLSIDRLVLDELREHDSWKAWNAAVPATNARPGSQIWGISNMGDDAAVVLDSRRDASLAGTDPALFIAEWSAPPEWRERVHKATDAELLEALAAANPNLGRRISGEALLSDGRAAIAAGGEELAEWLTEIMCIRIRSRNPAIDPGKWADLAEVVDLAAYRNRTVLCLDVAPDGQHATLAAAAKLPDEESVPEHLRGRVAIDVVAAWSGPRATADLRAELVDLVDRVRPRRLVWFPSGPAAQVAADMAKRKGWPPRRVRLEEIRGEVPAVCMGFAEQVRSSEVVHPDDALLNAHVTGAEKLPRGDQWVFSRRDAADGSASHVDGAYAVAGAVHVARVLPAPPAPLSIG